MHLALLLATLAALLSGPLLYACARTRPPLLALLDGFLLVSISGLVLLEAVPGTFSSGGAISVVFLLLGLLGPSALEHWLRRAQREAHLATLLLALLGLLVHSVGDGIALSSGGDLGEGLALPLAVALHSVPVGLVVWWLLFPVFGAAPPSLAIAGMCLATVAGFLFGPALGAQLGHSGWAWFQALVAGSILHVVFGRPHLDPHESGASDSPHFEGLGNLLALLGLIALEHLGHGHEHAGTAATAASFFAIFIALAQWIAPLVLGTYLIGGLLRVGNGWAAALKHATQRLVDASAAWLLALLALLALGLPRLLPDLVLPPPTLAHRLALGVLLLLFAASLLRRGGRAWIGDLWPHRSHGHSH